MNDNNLNETYFEKKVISHISLPDSIIRDYEIRVAMHDALQHIDDSLFLPLAGNDKADTFSSYKIVHQIDLEAPYEQPSCGRPGSHNDQLKEFAFDAFKALADYFGTNIWGNWSIVSHHGLETNDHLNSVKLGVIIQQLP